MGERSARGMLDTHEHVIFFYRPGHGRKERRKEKRGKTEQAVSELTSDDAGVTTPSEACSMAFLRALLVARPPLRLDWRRLVGRRVVNRIPSFTVGSPTQLKQ